MNEIAFAIHPENTLAQGCLVLDVLHLTKSGYDYHLSHLEALPLAKWRGLVKPSEKELFTFLLKEESAFQEKINGRSPHLDSLILKQLHVSTSQTQFFFELIAPTQKLFFKGKALVIDLFGKTEFYYEGQLHKGTLQIEGRLRWKETDISLNECDAMGPGKPNPWFVKGISLKFIQTPISWKQLQQLKHAPLLLEGAAKQSFIQELEEDEESPKLELKQHSIDEVLIQSSPLPILKLKDRWGACADLWIDYGNRAVVPYHDKRLAISQGKRQPLAEDAWEKDLLETDFTKKWIETSHYYCPLDKVAKSLTFLLDIGWKVLDIHERQVLKQTDLSFDFEEGEKEIKIKGKMKYDTYEADVSQVIGSFNKREMFIQLSDNTVGLLSFESQAEIQDIAENCELLSEGVKIKKHQFNLLEPLLNWAKTSPALEELKRKWHNFNGITETTPSPEFNGSLRHYQQEGLNWLSFLSEYHFHGILADEMGLGKTIQVLAFLSLKKIKGPHLIVMPTSLLFNWRNEIKQFLPHLKCLTYQGSERTNKKEDLEACDIILTSYTLLRLDLPFLSTLAYGCLVLDEAQMIKNAHTLTSQAVCRLNAQLRLSLTGTPIENHLEELWSHFHFLMPELFGTREAFQADTQAAKSDIRYLNKIKKKISPFLLRRRKEEVAKDLPPRFEQTVWIEMPDEQRMIYERLLRGFKTGLLKKVEIEGIGKHRIEVFEAILRLRQCCCHPLIISSLLEDSDSFISAKFDFLLQDLETLIEEEKKVLVYSQFTSILQLLAKAAKEREWSFAYLDGTTKDREKVVCEFQEDPKKNLFFISLKAGGVGLNLTAADYVYLYDPWWNDAVEEQAINRAHRIGRSNSVIAKRLVMAESIEEKITKIKSSKKQLIENVFEEGGTSSPFQLTFEDLEFLFS